MQKARRQPTTFACAASSLGNPGRHISEPYANTQSSCGSAILLAGFFPARPGSVALGLLLAPEVRGGGILPGLDDAAPDPARFSEKPEQGVAVPEADRPLQGNQILGE